MDFIVDCNLPMRPKGTQEEVPVEGKMRVISYEQPDIEVCTLFPGDTLCGVDLSQTPIKIQKDLRQAGMSTTFDYEALEFDDHPISMAIFEDEIATICWHRAATEKEN